MLLHSESREVLWTGSEKPDGWCDLYRNSFLPQWAGTVGRCVSLRLAAWLQAPTIVAPFVLPPPSPASEPLLFKSDEWGVLRAGIQGRLLRQLYTAASLFPLPASGLPLFPLWGHRFPPPFSALADHACLQEIPCGLHQNYSPTSSSWCWRLSPASAKLRWHQMSCNLFSLKNCSRERAGETDLFAVSVGIRWGEAPWWSICVHMKDPGFSSLIGKKKLKSLI